MPLMELHVLQDLQQKLTARRGSPAPAPWCAAAMDVLSPRVSRALNHATLAHAPPNTSCRLQTALFLPMVRRVERREAKLRI